jgi:hypothetical protein
LAVTKTANNCALVGIRIRSFAHRNSHALVDLFAAAGTYDVS